MEAAKIAAGISDMPLIWQLCCLAAATLLSCVIGAVTLGPDAPRAEAVQLFKKKQTLTP
jgi:hypothetical protein